MTQSHLQFQITKLQQTKLSLAVEAIAMLVFSLFGAAIVPQLIVQFIFANQAALLQPPTWFQYVPVTFFVLGMAYFLYAVISVIVTELKIGKLEKELAEVIKNCGCDDMCGCSSHGDCGCDPLDPATTEMMYTAQKVVDTASKKAGAKKTTKAGKTTKKTTTK